MTEHKPDEKCKLSEAGYKKPSPCRTVMGDNQTLSCHRHTVSDSVTQCHTMSWLFVTVTDLREGDRINNIQLYTAVYPILDTRISGLRPPSFRV